MERGRGILHLEQGDLDLPGNLPDKSIRLFDDFCRPIAAGWTEPLQAKLREP